MKEKKSNKRKRQLQRNKRNMKKRCKRLPFLSRGVVSQRRLILLHVLLHFFSPTFLSFFSAIEQNARILMWLRKQNVKKNEEHDRRMKLFQRRGVGGEETRGFFALSLSRRSFLSLPLPLPLLILKFYFGPSRHFPFLFIFFLFNLFSLPCCAGKWSFSPRLCWR